MTTARVWSWRGIGFVSGSARKGSSEYCSSSSPAPIASGSRIDFARIEYDSRSGTSIAFRKGFSAASRSSRSFFTVSALLRSPFIRDCLSCRSARFRRA